MRPRPLSVQFYRKTPMPQVADLDAVAIEQWASGTMLKLRLDGGSTFVVLCSKDGTAPTCYTDRGGTSRMSESSAGALVQFGHALIRVFGKAESPA